MNDALRITMKVTDLFLDRANIQRRVGTVRARVLRKQGAFIRTRSRSMLRRRKRVSAAGSPPSVHSNAPTYLKQIFYLYDDRTDSVVVGPVFLNGRSGLWSGGTVPGLHEFGGRALIREAFVYGRWQRFDARSRAHKAARKRDRNATYRRRPFMAPAMAKEIEAGTIPSAWSNVIRS